MSASTPTQSAVLPTPSAFEISEFLLCARFGDPTDLDDIKAFVQKYGESWLADAKDDRGNTCLHMAGGNGHAEIVSYLLPLLPPTALISPNAALSTPLHWISINYHLPILRLLCPLLPLSAFSLVNSQNKSPVQAAEEACESFFVAEAEEKSDRGRERVRREVVVGYLLGCMGLVGDRKSEEAVLDSVGGRDALAGKLEGISLGSEDKKVQEDDEEEVKMSM